MAVTAVPKETALVSTGRSRVKQQLVWVIAGVVAADALVVSLSTVVAFAIKFGLSTSRLPAVDRWTGIPLIDFGWMVPAWMLSLFVQDAYSRRQFARGTDEFKTLLRGSLTAAAAIAMIAYLVNYDMSRGFYLLTFSVGTGLLLLERFVIRRMIHRRRRVGRLMHRVVVSGTEHSIAELDRELRKNTGLGYEIVGTCPVGGEPVAACTALGADTLIVTGGFLTSSMDLRRIGWELGDSDIDLIVVPSLVDVAGPRIHMRPVAGLPLMHIEPPQVARAMKFGKALFDRVGALLLLVLVTPVMAGVALAVKLETSGPAFYRHRRVGVHGTEFGVWKFRSMVANSGAQHEDLLASHGGVALLFKVQDDPRVTRVGRFIRRYSLDELPQLFNVLIGQMSLVGPRPQVADEVAEYDDTAHRRLLVRPGITGLWQVSGRSNLTWDEAVRLDLSYVDNWSMTGDIVILAKTFRAVLRHDGAY